MSAIAVKKVSCVWAAGRILGEGPWWSERERAVYWVDVKQPAILRYIPESGDKAEWPCPEAVGCCAPRSDSGLIVALRSGLYTAELEAPGSPLKLRFLSAVPGLIDTDRLNDGKCHQDGSFWVGTMDDAEISARGFFYRFSAEQKMEKVAGPYTVCNGPAFSPDGSIAYLTDSTSRRVYRYKPAHPRLSPELFLQFSERDGYPDGMTTDIEGRLWIAMWDGGKVVCFGQEGDRLFDIALPISRPTSCTFGGPALQTLYVSSASIKPCGGHASEPLAGGLFAVELHGAKGQFTPVFKGV